MYWGSTSMAAARLHAGREMSRRLVLEPRRVSSRPVVPSRFPAMIRMWWPYICGDTWSRL